MVGTNSESVGEGKVSVNGVQNGIVLDHINAGDAMRLYKLLNLGDLECTVAIIQRVESEKYGRKDIIKIDQEIDVDLDALGYIDPRITVNVVKDGKLAEKKHVELPRTLRNIVRCKNPRCVTSQEETADHVFILVDPEREIYRCAYCEAAADNRGGRVRA